MSSPRRHFGIEFSNCSPNRLSERLRKGSLTSSGRKIIAPLGRSQRGNDSIAWATRMGGGLCSCLWRRTAVPNGRHDGGGGSAGKAVVETPLLPGSSLGRPFHKVKIFHYGFLIKTPCKVGNFQCSFRLSAGGNGAAIAEQKATRYAGENPTFRVLNPGG
jgi:hypothetical protein